jgi:hypothetical protein
MTIAPIMSKNWYKINPEEEISFIDACAILGLLPTYTIVNPDNTLIIFVDEPSKPTAKA